jgi:hypothetical protein
MPVQTYGKELRQDVNLMDAAIDAVRQWYVDQPVLAGQRNRRL